MTADRSQRYTHHVHLGRIAHWKRTLAAVLALAVLGLELGPALHRSSVRHATCAEHGESVELSLLASQVAPAGPAAWRASDGAATHGHDHCLLGRIAPSHGAQRARLDAPSSRLTSVSRFTVAAARPPRVIALLAQAPKLPPPA